MKVPSCSTLMADASKHAETGIDSTSQRKMFDALTASTLDTIGIDDFGAPSRMVTEEIPQRGHDIRRHDAAVEAIASAIEVCPFACTAAESADFSQELCALAISTPFEEMAQCPKSALLGTNLRCLRSESLGNCPSDRIRLRIARAGGAPATSVQIMRRFTGELFRCILHIECVTAGPSDAEGSCLRFPIGIYIDISEDEQEEIDDDKVLIEKHAAVISERSRWIQAEVVRQRLSLAAASSMALLEPNQLPKQFSP